MKFSTFAFLGLVANLATTQGIELTSDNYDVESEGKTAFIKFFAPWCGHCKKMKPDWDKLMDEFKDSKTQLVADVDCTSDGGKPLCDANGVRGYPTLKWGDPAGLEDYKGARDFDSLKKFVEENLKPICSPSNLDLCDDAAKAEIEKYFAMGTDQLQKEVDAKQAELDQAEEDFKTLVQSLQTQYTEAMEAKDKKIEEVKTGGLALMKQCLTALSKKGNDEL